MNLSKLIDLCHKHTVEISFNGIPTFTHKVINAETLLAEIHTTSELDKETFTKNINNGNFMTPQYEDIFTSIKNVGMFRQQGAEALNGSKNYIECKSLTWLIEE